MKKGFGILGILYFVLAFYLLNDALNFISLPEFILGIDRWLVLISGILLALGGINFLRIRKRNY